MMSNFLQDSDSEKSTFKRVRMKSSRPTDGQKRSLLKFIEKNKVLNSGIADTKISSEEYQDLWKKLTDHLNSMLGANKTWEKWRQCWRDIKKDVRRKHEANPKYKLPEFEERVKKLIRDFNLEKKESLEDNLLKIIRTDEDRKIRKEGDLLKLEQSVVDECYSKKSKRGPSMSRIQKEMLTDFMKDKKKLRHGSYDASFTKDDATLFWQYIGMHLNSVEDGVKKEWFQWRKCWHDVKHEAKNKLKAGKELSYLDNLLLSLSEDSVIPESNSDLPLQYKIPYVSLDDLKQINVSQRSNNIDNNKILQDHQDSGSGDAKSLKRSLNVSKEQKRTLIKFLRKYPKLATGSFDKDFSKRDGKKLWQLLALKLNSVEKGAEKNFEQWRKCWNDIKKEVKKKHENRKLLSDYEKIVFKIIKKEITLETKFEVKSGSVQMPSFNDFEYKDLSEFTDDEDDDNFILANKCAVLYFYNENQTFYIKCQKCGEVFIQYQQFSIHFMTEHYLNHNMKNTMILTTPPISSNSTDNKDFPQSLKVENEPENTILHDDFKSDDKSDLFSEEILMNIQMESDSYCKPDEMDTFAANYDEIIIECGEDDDDIVDEIKPCINYETIHNVVKDNDIILKNDAVIEKNEETKGFSDSLDEEIDSFQNTSKKDVLAEIKRVENTHQYTEFVVQCKICDRHSVSNRQRYTHEKIYHSEQLLFCKISSCFETFIIAEEFNLHFDRNHTDNPKLPYKCPQCFGLDTKMFPNKDQFTRHIQRIHFKEKNFECRHCGKQFFDRKETFEHESSHTGQHQICDYCGYTTIYKHNLLSHIKIKHKPHEFLCEICNKSFALRSNLTKHQKSVHSKEKPFICNVCGAAFGCREYLRKHTYKKHEVNYRCEKCGSSFNRKSKLTEHLELNICVQWLQ